MEDPKNFVIWLSGYLDACEGNLTEKQTQVVKERLNGIFEHEAEEADENPTTPAFGEEPWFPSHMGGPGGIEGEDVKYRC